MTRRYSLAFVHAPGSTPSLEAVEAAHLPVKHPLAIDEDFFAGLLAGDERLGHHVVFYGPEQTFYFLDCRFGYYAPTTEEKLQVLLSQYFVRCAESMSWDVDLMNLFVLFRKPETLKAIVKRARAILLASESFFTGSSGRKRLVGDEVCDPTVSPPHKLFVREMIVAQPKAILSVAEAYQEFLHYCAEHEFKPLERWHFKGLWVP